jgi:hypothetical protein
MADAAPKVVDVSLSAVQEVTLNTDVKQPVLHVRYADNEGLVLLNGNPVFHKRTEGNPDLKWKVDLTENLVSGRNVLVVTAANRNGPSHFWAYITDGDVGPVIASFRRDIGDTVWGIFYFDSLIIRKDDVLAPARTGTASASVSTRSSPS